MAGGGWGLLTVVARCAHHQARGLLLLSVADPATPDPDRVGEGSLGRRSPLPPEAARH